MRGTAVALICAAAIIGACDRVCSFPLGVTVGGGVGVGYYSMDELNEHIGIIGQENALTIKGITNGVNFRVEGRLWYEHIAALTGGYEHFWGETNAVEASSSLSYRTPADVYTLGAIVAVLRLENSFDLCIGMNRCWSKVVFGTNEITGRRLTEFKGEETGYEAYAEIHTNFINPIEVGLQLGYRGIKIETLNDKFGEPGYFDSDRRITIDYSGVFFYLTTAIRIN
jgi:hypothetical protein